MTTTKTLSGVVLSAMLVGSAVASVQVASSQIPAPVLAADGAVVLIVPAPAQVVPTAAGLKVAPSPVVRITP